MTTRMATPTKEELLRTYYAKHYPVRAIERLLTFNGDPLVQREITLDGDYYKRYNAAKDDADFRRLMNTMPGLKAVHAGPIWYKVVRKPRPVDQSTGEVPDPDPPRPNRNELRFDIDLNDYDWLDLYDVPFEPERPNEKRELNLDACDDAWPVAGMAVLTLWSLLMNQFGFSHFFCCYSGRRGVHFWVLDERAMALDNEARAAIAEFVDFKESKCKLRASSSHRKFVNSLDYMHTVRYRFQEYIVSRMGVLDSAAGREEFLKRLDLGWHESMHNLAEEVERKDSGTQVWFYIKNKIKDQATRHPKTCGWFLDRLDEVMLAYVWPRIDINVTKGLNHLIKAPFVAHPKTMRIAVPLQVRSVLDVFNPRMCPTVTTTNVPEGLHEYGGDADGKGINAHIWHTLPKPDAQGYEPDRRFEYPNANGDATPMDVDMEDLVAPTVLRGNAAVRVARGPRMDVYGNPIG